MRVKLLFGDCLERMKEFSDNFMDTCITDSPYGLTDITQAKIESTLLKWLTGDDSYVPAGKGFMGKEWDKFVPPPAVWKEVYRVLKPGATLLCFAGTKTCDIMTMSLRLAGFEIRDTIMWLHGQGFPKSYNISKGIEGKLTQGSANWNEWKKLDGKDIDSNSRGALGLVKTNKEQGNRPTDYGEGRQFELEPTTSEAELWQGYGTALKPAWEPIIVAMKPRDGSFVDNALKHGVAGLNIGGSKIPLQEGEEGYTINTWDDNAHPFGDGAGNPYTGRKETKGRWPANVILDEVAAEMLDEQTGNLKSGDCPAGFKGEYKADVFGKYANNIINPETIYADNGGASRFFYCAKASRKEKNNGLKNLPENDVAYSQYRENFKDTKDFVTHYPDGSPRPVNPTKNNHPTVKPLKLMEYLCILTKTPTGGIVFDPFMGSGTTGVACANPEIERDFIGIEKDEHYFKIAKARIQAART